MSKKEKQIYSQFPSLTKSTSKKPPLYFDNACMTLKPQVVIDELVSYYEKHPSCHNRAIHSFGELTSQKFSQARLKIKAFINADTDKSVIFTRNTTESINIIAKGLGLKKNECVLTSDIEHNSNFLPWQFAVHSSEINHLTFEISTAGEFDLIDYENKLIENDVKLVSTFYTSHVLGITLPIKEMCSIAHKHGALFFLDAAQAAGHQQIDVVDLNIDFMAFSFHKIFGPSGIGCLYGKYDLLDQIEPLIYGGETVLDVTESSCVMAQLPAKLEAGLQDYSGAMGAGAAVEFINSIGFQFIQQNDLRLNEMFTTQLMAIPRVTILGPPSPAERGSIINFNVSGMDCGELSIMLSKSKNIMVRSGVHCAHSWFNKNKLSPSLRISTSIYNTKEEVLEVIEVLKTILKNY
jgi:cysteine desulfurase/selenocysteine lyase